MPPGPWLYPEDQIADAPMRALAAEITREKLFERLHDELPYQTTVETDSWKDLPDGSARIEQTIYRHAREPQEDRHRRGRPHDQGDRLGGAQGDRRGQREPRCICSCSSKCARTGSTTPSAIARWGWSSRRGEAPPQVQRYDIHTFLATELAPTGRAGPPIAGASSPRDQVRGSSQRRFSAIEMRAGKRNFDAAAPHWLSASFAPHPPCFSLLTPLFSLFRARSSRQSAAKKIFLFSWL